MYQANTDNVHKLYVSLVCDSNKETRLKMLAQQLFYGLDALVVSATLHWKLTLSNTHQHTHPRTYTYVQQCLYEFQERTSFVDPEKYWGQYGLGDLNDYDFECR